MVGTNRHVVRGPDRRVTTLSDTPSRLARGTRQDISNALPRPMPGGAVVEHQMGIMWMVDMRVETLARNFAVAGAIEFGRRLGEAFPREVVQPWERF